MKKKIEKLFFICFLVLIVCGCSSNGIKQTLKSIEVNTEYSLLELFEVEEDVTIKYDGGTSLKQTDIGKKEISIDINKNGKESKATFTFDVVDKTAPTITYKNDEIIQGSSINLDDFVVAEDNYDLAKDIKVKIDSGNIDTTTIGEYQVTISATDTSGNCSTSQMTIKVVEPKSKIEIGAKYTATGDGDKIEFTINSIVWQQTVESYSTNMFRSYYSDQTEETYFVIKMTIKNLGSDTTGYYIFEDWEKGDPYVIFDNNYKYNLYQMDTTSSVLSKYWSLAPLKSMDVFMLASVPDELVGKSYEVNFSTSDTTFVCDGN